MPAATRLSATERYVAEKPCVWEDVYKRQGYHGETYNVNADVAAASIAAKLGAMKLILMTDVKGYCGIRMTKAP